MEYSYNGSLNLEKIKQKLENRRKVHQNFVIKSSVFLRAEGRLLFML